MGLQKGWRRAYFLVGRHPMKNNTPLFDMLAESYHVSKFWPPPLTLHAASGRVFLFVMATRKGGTGGESKWQGRKFVMQLER